MEISSWSCKSSFVQKEKWATKAFLGFSFECNFTILSLKRARAVENCEL